MICAEPRCYETAYFVSALLGRWRAVCADHRDPFGDEADMDSHSQLLELLSWAITEPSVRGIDGVDFIVERVNDALLP